MIEPDNGSDSERYAAWALIVVVALLIGMGFVARVPLAGGIGFICIFIGKRIFRNL